MANGFQGPPAFDFYSQLSGLGDTIAKNRADAAKRDAYTAALTPDPVTGKVDFGKAILGLGQVDPHAAALLQSVQAHQDAQKNADRSYNHTVERDTVNDQHYATTDRRAANADARAAAAEGRARQDWENTPDQYTPNPAYKDDATTPGVPKFVDNYERSKAAADALNPTYSTTPIYGTDTDPNSPTYGKPVIMQAGKNGELRRSKLPEGVSMPDGSSEDSLTTRANRYLDTGDPKLIERRSFGAGQQGQAEYDKLQNRIEELRQKRGMRADEVSSNAIDTRAKGAAATAGARTRATREANLNMILDVTDSAVPAALEMNANIPRGKLVPLSKLIQKGQVMTSDADLNDFGIANLQLAEGWARAMNPTGVMRESDRDKALHFLDVGLANGTYERAVKQVQKQIHRERDAIKTGGGETTYDHRAINGGRPIKVDSPEDAAQYPSGTKILIPNGNGGFSPGVVP